jgi:hypothetical protein
MQVGASPFGVVPLGSTGEEAFRTPVDSFLASARVETGIILSGGTVEVQPDAIAVGVVVGDVTTWATFNTFPVSIAVGAVVGNPNPGIFQLAEVSAIECVTEVPYGTRMAVRTTAPVADISIAATGHQFAAISQIPAVNITGLGHENWFGINFFLVPAQFSLSANTPHLLICTYPVATDTAVIGIVPDAAVRQVPATKEVFVSAQLPDFISVLSAPTKDIAVSRYVPDTTVNLGHVAGFIFVTVYSPLSGSTTGTKVVVMNTKTLAISEYMIPGLVDVVEHDGEVYFVTGTGLSKLADPAGADESAVVSYIQTGDLTFAQGQRINLWRVHTDLASDAPMRVTTRLDMAGQERDIAYTVPERSSTQSRSRVVELARGPRAERWAIKIGTTETGGNWAIDSLAVVPGATKRGR